jgi:uncharacterized protein YggT (Ycf19 family)
MKLTLIYETTTLLVWLVAAILVNWFVSRDFEKIIGPLESSSIAPCLQLLRDVNPRLAAAPAPVTSGLHLAV